MALFSTAFAVLFLYLCCHPCFVEALWPDSAGAVHPQPVSPKGHKYLTESGLATIRPRPKSVYGSRNRPPPPALPGSVAKSLSSLLTASRGSTHSLGGGTAQADKPLAVTASRKQIVYTQPEFPYYSGGGPAKKAVFNSRFARTFYSSIDIAKTRAVGALAAARRAEWSRRAAMSNGRTGEPASLERGRHLYRKKNERPVSSVQNSPDMGRRRDEKDSKHQEKWYKPRFSKASAYRVTKAVSMDSASRPSSEENTPTRSISVPGRDYYPPSGAFYERDGRLYQDGKALPKSLSEIQRDNSDARWFEKDPMTGKWHKRKMREGLEWRTREPVKTSLPPSLEPTFARERPSRA
ncbi:hypothetical protein CDD80_4342 [Ophiocordyceps camponoti-rufipedis]|uniref:Uncharacterized protein n=1 Tax=Ophiocordyceps camponoti-rufipedis TaxID=2004952 RepID=A0A2C5YSG2_9HYPO|nr:hypothetical protein CDD80_4342 [Ophiocordyceps camponoti-rufipedis]